MKWCHPCSLPGRVFHPARRWLAAIGAAQVGALGGEGAGFASRGGGIFRHS